MTRNCFRITACSLLVVACASNRASITSVPANIQAASGSNSPSELPPENTSDFSSAIYRGDPNEISLIDVAVCLSALGLPGDTASADHIAISVNALLGTPNATDARSFDPVPVDSQCDYAFPEGEFNLVDVAVVFGALNQSSGSLSQDTIANAANNLLSQAVLSDDRIIAIPSIDLPGPVFVNTLEDENGENPNACSLREALTANNESSNFGGCSNPEGIVEFSAELSGTISLQGQELTISSDVIIQGPGSENLTIDANQQSRVLTVSDEDSTSVIEVQLNGMTITGGRPEESRPGGGIYNTESLSIRNSTITGNSTIGEPLFPDGGGIISPNGAGIYTSAEEDITLTISNSIISENSSSQSGGGIHISGGSFNISESEVRNNSAENSGGGIKIDSSLATITNSQISNNSTSELGGGISLGGYTNSELTLSESTIENNTSTHGGGIHTDRGTAQIVNSSLSGNTASSRGGGINSYDTKLDIVSSQIENNNAGFTGGGIFGEGGNYRETTTLANSTVSGNVASNSGGGLYVGTSTYNYSTYLEILDSTISNNSSEIGGGIFIIFNTAPDIKNTTVSQNTASAGAGLMTAYLGSANIRNSTFSFNVAQSGGGGISTEGDGRGAGGVNIVSSISAGNLGSSNPDLFCEAEQPSCAVGFSLIENGIIGRDLGDNILNQDPLLDPEGLKDNGGSTLTIGLQSNSPAIDAGSNPENLSADQRGEGFARVVNGSADIGAFETQ